ncbi:MAG: hypothetical protein SGARI_004853 [Bacillariaceae sp.]
MIRHGGFVVDIYMKCVLPGMNSPIGSRRHLDVFPGRIFRTKQALQRLSETAFHTAIPSQVSSIGHQAIFLILLDAP